MDRRAEMDPDHWAELEDRAAEQVDRDWLLAQERDDWHAARAEQHAADCAVLEKRALEWCDVKDRSGHPSDYGWWGGVL